MAAIPVPATGKGLLQEWLNLTAILVSQSGILTSDTVAQAQTKVSNELNAH